MINRCFFCGYNICTTIIVYQWHLKLSNYQRKRKSYINDSLSSEAPKQEFCWNIHQVWIYLLFIQRHIIQRALLTLVVQCLWSNKKKRTKEFINKCKVRIDIKMIQIMFPAKWVMICMSNQILYFKKFGTVMQFHSKMCENPDQGLSKFILKVYSEKMCFEQNTEVGLFWWIFNYKSTTDNK